MVLPEVLVEALSDPDAVEALASLIAAEVDQGRRGVRECVRVVARRIVRAEARSPKGAGVEE